MNDQEKIKEIYEEWLLTVEPQVRLDNPFFLNLVRILPEDREIRILDAGCGNGAFALELSRRGYLHISACDLFASLPEPGTIDYRQASIDDLPWTDGAFDFVICNSVIFYLDEPLLGLREIARVLKPGGQLWMTSHTKYSLYTLKRVILRGIAPSTMLHLQGVRFFSVFDYERWMKDAGFSQLASNGIRLLPLPELLRRLLIHPKLYGENWPLGRTYRMLRALFAYHSVLFGIKV